MISKLKPVIVLSAICTLVCALLIVTYNLTYVDTSGIITDKLKTSCTAVDGGSDYELITDRASVGLDKEEYEEITKIVKNKTTGSYLYEVVVSGYADDGIDVVVGIDEKGAVKGISIVALQETPGLGTKINDKAFLEKFIGADSDITITKNPPSADNEVQAITSATYSSKGLAKAVNLAIAADKAVKEVQ